MSGGGRPKGRIDNPYNKRKKRAETEEQKNERIRKSAETRKRNQESASAKRAFVQNMARQTPKQAALADTTSTIDGGEGNNKEGEINDTENEEQDDDSVIVNETITNVPALDVIANLDIDDDNSTEDFNVYDECDLTFHKANKDDSVGTDVWKIVLKMLDWGAKSWQCLTS